MAWKRIHVRCTPEQPGHEIATAWLAEAGCSMFEDTPQGLTAYGQAEEIDGGLLATIERDLAPLGLSEWRISEVEDENWNARWESDYPEVEVGRDVRISAPFHHRSDSGGFAHQITIQPRMAFGTGHHGTTAGILAEMAGMDWTGQRILDMGCGSGVLGIYAAMRGAAEVLFVDIDAWSVRNTLENLELNGFGQNGRFEVREGGVSVLGSADEGRFDVVIANINRNILMEDMEHYSRVARVEATLMLSGFMAPDVPLLETRAEACGWAGPAVRNEGEWRVLTLRR